MKNKKEHLEQGAEEALSEALSPIINKLIDKNYETSKDKIASQMAPLIGSAIREQIKHQKDDVVDALYPVMGNMISRYVSKSLEEMLESINQKIQSGLSIDTLKRKIKAKVKGISETELLLQESSTTHIKAILLIHKETGIVLTQAHALDSTAIDEPEMVASMMTAIRSFINDWVEKNEKNSEVGEIDYGGSKIVIENSGYSYLAAIVDGAIYNKTYDKIRKTLEDVVIEYGQDIRDFNGDLDKFPTQEIKQKFLPLFELENDEKEKTKKIHPLIFIIPILLIGFLSWRGYENYLDKKLLNNINTTLYKTPQLTIYRIEAILQNNKILIKGEVPTIYHKNLASDIIKELRTKKNIDNQLIVIKAKDTPNEIASKISYTIQGLNTQDCLSLNYTYTYPTLILSGDSCDKEHKDKAVKILKSITNNIKDNIKIIVPKINTTVYFKKASYKIDKTQKNKLFELANTLKKIDKNKIVVITGYSDNRGTLKSRKHISKKRALKIKTILKNEFFVKQKIKIIANGDSPKNIDLNKSPDKARCSIITLEF